MQDALTILRSTNNAVASRRRIPAHPASSFGFRTIVGLNDFRIDSFLNKHQGQCSVIAHSPAMKGNGVLIAGRWT